MPGSLLDDVLSMSILDSALTAREDRHTLLYEIDKVLLTKVLYQVYLNKICILLYICTAYQI